MSYTYTLDLFYMYHVEMLEKFVMGAHIRTID